MTRSVFAAASILFFATLVSAQASEPSVAQLQRQASNYYRAYARLSAGQQNDAAAVIAEELAEASPERFNEVLVQLMAHYREEPTHRAAIETLARAVRDKVLPELAEDRNRNGALTFAGDMLSVFATYYAGRSLWAARSGRTVRPSDIQHAMRELMIAGTLIGSSHVLYDELREHRQDPAAALARVREQIVQEFATQVREIRIELMSLLAETDAQLAARGTNATRVRLARIETQGEQIDRQLTELAQLAPELRGLIRPVTLAWIEIEHLCDEVGVRNDRIQFGPIDDLRTPLRAP